MTFLEMKEKYLSGKYPQFVLYADIGISLHNLNILLNNDYGFEDRNIHWCVDTQLKSTVLDYCNYLNRETRK